MISFKKGIMWIAEQRLRHTATPLMTAHAARQSKAAYLHFYA
jgi:hypothetical protein